MCLGGVKDLSFLKKEEKKSDELILSLVLLFFAIGALVLGSLMHNGFLGDTTPLSGPIVGSIIIFLLFSPITLIYLVKVVSSLFENRKNRRALETKKLEFKKYPLSVLELEFPPLGLEEKAPPSFVSSSTLGAPSKERQSTVDGEKHSPSVDLNQLSMG